MLGGHLGSLLYGDVSVMICYFSYFQFWFRGQDFGSGCASSWPFLTFYFRHKFDLFLCGCDSVFFSSVSIRKVKIHVHMSM